MIIQRPTREAGSAENRKVAAEAADAAVTIRVRSQTRDSADATRGGARRREADQGRQQRDRRDWQTHWTELRKHVSGSCDGVERRGVYRSGTCARRPYSLWLERRRAGEKLSSSGKSLDLEEQRTRLSTLQRENPGRRVVYIGLKDPYDANYLSVIGLNIWQGDGGKDQTE